MSGRRQRRQQHREESDEVRLSKWLSWLLRHGAEEEGLPMGADGYAPLADVLSRAAQRDAAWTEAAVRRVVAASDKQRFALSADGARIRANQGHSIARVDAAELLRRVSAPDAAPRVAVHGTYRRLWPAIKASGGLRRMGRNHVHMAQGLPGAAGVVSGMRSDCDTLVYVDAARIVADGALPLFVSANGVVLCEEVPIRYFRAVVGRDGLPFDPDFPALP